jgi:hypothetical protein
MKTDDCKRKVKQSIFEAYGVDSFSKTEDFRKMYSDTNFIKDIRIKVNQTCLEKYGLDCYSKTDEYKQRAKQTCLEKYGVPYYTQFNEYVIKTKMTCLEKYGVDSFSKTEECKQKAYETKKANHSFNISKEEDKVYEVLLQKYPDVKRQYKEARYPYACDFYIPSLDMFIECNFHWTHGLAPYDSNNPKHINIVYDWQSRASKYYDNAILVWTVRDVEKQALAKTSKINYLYFYNYNEFLNWYEKGF